MRAVIPAGIGHTGIVLETSVVLEVSKSSGKVVFFRVQGKRARAESVGNRVNAWAASLFGSHFSG